MTRIHPGLARSSPVVLKLGGRVLESARAWAELAADLAACRTPLVVVHGGGAEVSAWSERMGLTPRFVDGLRVTDEATLEIAAAVLAGLANKRLVAVLRAGGVDAVGIAALDGGLTEVVPHPRAAELGAVGAVACVDRTLIDVLHAAGRTPVVASLGEREGRLLNVNADDLAAAIAGALGARAMLLLSDAPGVRIDGVVVPRLDRAGLLRAQAHPDVVGGMSAKLHAALAALDAGVARVHIGSWQGPETIQRLIRDEADGTRIAATAREGVHA